MMSLRKRLIRLAHENPGKIREAVLPLLKESRKKLTRDDLRAGLRIKQTQHPEYGDWKILGRARGTGSWEVQREDRRGTIVVDGAELIRFWEKA